MVKGLVLEIWKHLKPGGGPGAVAQVVKERIQQMLQTKSPYVARTIRK